MRAVCSSLTFKAQSPDSACSSGRESQKAETNAAGVRDPLREDAAQAKRGTHSRRAAFTQRTPSSCRCLQNVPL